MTPTYTVIINYNDDQSADSGEDITADVLRLEWRLGFAAPYQTIAAPITARITLRNPTRAHSPEASANPYTPGLPLYIRSDDGVTSRTHFTGFITHVEPTPGDQGERLTVITAGGVENQLVNARARLPPQVGQRADQVIAAVLDAVPLRRPHLAGYWLLDIPSYAELDANTRLPDDYPRALEHGLTTFAYTADTWGGGLPALDAVRQMAEAERGRFFMDRDGVLVFHNRHYTLLSTTPVAAFSDDMDGLEYAYGADVANCVTVTLLPRSIGAVNTTLWTLENPQALQPGEAGVRVLIARYRDAQDRPLGALSVVPPVPYIDYTANTLPDGTGEDRTGSVGVLLAETGASAAVLTVRNNGLEPVFLLPGMKLRGTPIIQGDPITLEHIDWTSVSLHGLSALSFNLPALDSVEAADQLARFELARRKDPRGVLWQMTLSGTTHLPQILARTLFDRITITETQTGHSAGYFIIAEHHTVDLGGFRHVVNWLLEPAAAHAFWVIETSLLDHDTVLAY